VPPNSRRNFFQEKGDDVITKSKSSIEKRSKQDSSRIVGKEYKNAKKKKKKLEKNLSYEKKKIS